MSDRNSPLFVLASASPTRSMVLRNAGISPTVRVSDFDESQIHNDDPIALVQTLAQGKAAAVAAKVAVEFSDRHVLVLGCDSVLWLNGIIYGKPGSREHAIAMWQKMRGNVGEIYTGHCLIDTQAQRTVIRYGVTKVHFVDATDSEITSYIDTGEPINCAGCFTLESLGGLLIEKLEGCHTNVLGLSLPLLRQMLRELSYTIKFMPGEVEILPNLDKM
jgi:septum formation protein